jgi:hypothetical protein
MRGYTVMDEPARIQFKGDVRIVPFKKATRRA